MSLRPRRAFRPIPGTIRFVPLRKMENADFHRHSKLETLPAVRVSSQSCLSDCGRTARRLGDPRESNPEARAVDEQRTREGEMSARLQSEQSRLSELQGTLDVLKKQIAGEGGIRLAGLGSLTLPGSVWRVLVFGRSAVFGTVTVRRAGSGGSFLVLPRSGPGREARLVGLSRNPVSLRSRRRGL